MITTYEQWKADGKPRKLATPIYEIRRELIIIHGQETVDEHVGTLGKTSTHLQVKHPQDHAPFSQSGWPIYSPYPYIHALDDSSPQFRRRFRYFIDERRAGRAPWVKYINLDGWHYEWIGAEGKNPSSDDPGHAHLSIRSDWTRRSIAYGWQTVRYGDRGGNVIVLQRMLHKHGHQLAVDGIFGPDTRRTVERFQAARRIVIDGIAGPRTRVSLAVLA